MSLSALPTEILIEIFDRVPMEELLRTLNAERFEFHLGKRKRAEEASSRSVSWLRIREAAMDSLERRLGRAMEIVKPKAETAPPPTQAERDAAIDVLFDCLIYNGFFAETTFVRVFGESVHLRGWLRSTHYVWIGLSKSGANRSIIASNGDVPANRFPLLMDFHLNVQPPSFENTNVRDLRYLFMRRCCIIPSKLLMFRDQCRNLRAFSIDTICNSRYEHTELSPHGEPETVVRFVRDVLYNNRKTLRYFKISLTADASGANRHSLYIGDPPPETKWLEREVRKFMPNACTTKGLLAGSNTGYEIFDSELSRDIFNTCIESTSDVERVTISRRLGLARDTSFQPDVEYLADDYETEKCLCRFLYKQVCKHDEASTSSPAKRCRN